MNSNKKATSFDNLAGGMAGEKFQLALQDVLKNIMDPNTDAKKKRAVTIELTFEPDEGRDIANVTVQCKTKLAPVVHSFTRLAIGVDKSSGKAVAQEFGVHAEENALLVATTPKQEIFK